jgi:ABC-type lipoprotein release transport system permease subunit
VLTLIVVPVGVVAVATIASIVPTRRAVKVDPLTAIRHG